MTGTTRDDPPTLKPPGRGAALHAWVRALDRVKLLDTAPGTTLASLLDGLAKGLADGRAVALLMPNRPEYVALWLGLTRAGCVVALLNTNLAADALLHGLRAADARHLIADTALLPALDGQVPPGLEVWVHGEGQEFRTATETRNNFLRRPS